MWECYFVGIYWQTQVLWVTSSDLHGRSMNDVDELHTDTNLKQSEKLACCIDVSVNGSLGRGCYRTISLLKSIDRVNTELLSQNLMTRFIYCLFIVLDLCNQRQHIIIWCETERKGGRERESVCEV